MSQTAAAVIFLLRVIAVHYSGRMEVKSPQLWSKIKDDNVVSLFHLAGCPEVQHGGQMQMHLFLIDIFRKKLRTT